MNKFTRVGATILFALFLTACDKPAEKAPQKATETIRTAVVKVEPLSAEEAADYAKVVEWNKTQQAAQTVAQQKLQEGLIVATQTKDEKKVVSAIEAFNQNIQATIKNLDGLEVKSDLIKGIKAKTKEVLELSSNLLVEQSKLASIQPTEDQIKTYQEKATILQNALTELQKQSIELEARAAAK